MERPVRTTVIVLAGLLICQQIGRLFIPATEVPRSWIRSSRAQEAQLESVGTQDAEAESAEPEGADPSPGYEQPGRTGLPIPRFVSLRASEVNLRTGPGVRYPIDWVYHRRDLPVEVIDEFETWRRIRDWEGTVGWVHQSMLQGARRALITGEARTLRQEPEKTSPPVARIEPGVIGRLENCEEIWCEVTVNGLSGWLQRHEFYGVYPREELQ